MKKLLILSFVLCCGLPFHAYAQDKSMAELFKMMPDSILPYLSENNRLDMVDFMEAHMKAEVTNLLEGKSEMKALTADSLSIRMSESLKVDMKVVKLNEPIDSCKQVICLTKTYQIKENQTESVMVTYSSVWRKLSSVQKFSSLLKRDEELADKPHL